MILTNKTVLLKETTTSPSTQITEGRQEAQTTSTSLSTRLTSTSAVTQTTESQFGNTVKVAENSIANEQFSTTPMFSKYTNSTVSTMPTGIIFDQMLQYHQYSKTLGFFSSPKKIIINPNNTEKIRP